MRKRTRLNSHSQLIWPHYDCYVVPHTTYVSHCNPMVNICSVGSTAAPSTSLWVQHCSFVVVSDAQKIYIISFSLSHFLHNQLFYPKLQRNWKGFGVVLLIDSSQNSCYKKVTHTFNLTFFWQMTSFEALYESAIV